MLATSLRDWRTIVRACKQRLAEVWVWVTALLLLAQPCAGLHCSCRHVAQHMTSCASAGCEHHCGHTCSHAHAPRTFRRVCAIAHSSLVEGLHNTSPCGCPANCPCRIQHSQQQFGLLRSASYERLDDVAQLPVVDDQPLTDDQADENLALFPTPPTLLTSSECCALFCRFTI